MFPGNARPSLAPGPGHTVEGMDNRTRSATSSPAAADGQDSRIHRVDCPRDTPAHTHGSGSALRSSAGRPASELGHLRAPPVTLWRVSHSNLFGRVPRVARLDFESQSVTSAGRRQRANSRYDRQADSRPDLVSSDQLAICVQLGMGCAAGPRPDLHDEGVLINGWERPAVPSRRGAAYRLEPWAGRAMLGR